MKKFIKINLALILLILIVNSSSVFAGQVECKTLLDSINDGQNGKVIELINDTNVNCVSNGDGTPLINAARSGNLTLVAVLTLFNADVNQSLLGDGNPLIQASRHGHLEIVAYLVQNGADVNAFVQEDETPLINASAKGHLNIVKLLLANGADVNKAVWSNTPSGRELRSPISMAKRNNQTEITSYLKRLGVNK